MRVFLPLPPLDEQIPLGWCRCCGKALYPGDRAASRDGDLLCEGCAPEELPLLNAEAYFLSPTGVCRSPYTMHHCGAAPRKRS